MQYDLIVIGGGPAGLMAAGRAAECGARVLLLEKNAEPGIKLLLTGKERCNLTNAIGSRDMVKSFGTKGKFLFSALSRFDSESAINFFEKLGVKIKIENNNRAFPKSDKAFDVRKALLDYLRQGKVEIAVKSEVKKIIKKDDLIAKIILKDGRELSAKNFIIATGGKSYPLTGSTGDSYTWTKSLGHNIVEPLPALVPIIVKNNFVKHLEGASLAGVKFTVKKDNKIVASQTGDAIFTYNGLSGPAILAISGLVARELPGVNLIIDFLPDDDFPALDLKLQKLFSENNNRQIKNTMAGLLPPKLIPVLLKLSKIDSELKTNQISKTDRQNLVKTIKNFELTVEKVDGFNKAMMTTGGVDLKEVEPSTMKSKIIKNLYLAGEVLDIDGPTGGFNLQACWSTGRLAGESAAKKLS
jgi:hypothetical protein